MFFQEYYPKSLIDPKLLDNYLAKGWFRSGNMLYRSTITFFQDEIYAVVRTRLPLGGFRFKKRLRKMLNRNNRLFEVRIVKSVINEEKEALYRLHQNRFDGYIPHTLQEYLLENSIDSVFDSYEVQVYDGKKLIGVSFFDLGKEGAASILALYDQTYSKYSLGIYTMLLEVEYCQQTGRKYFYPGYILIGNARFDYKLRLGKEMEYYQGKGIWRNMAELAGDKPFLESLKVEP